MSIHKFYYSIFYALFYKFVKDIYQSYYSVVTNICFVTVFMKEYYGSFFKHIRENVNYEASIYNRIYLS